MAATAWKPCIAESTSPTITISAIAAMNMYVGAANNAPAAFTPRRFPNTRTAITTSPSGTVAEVTEGMAEVMAATPEATDTATVRM